MVKYNAESITTMPFGVACNKKRGMYLSANDKEALLLGLRELIANSQDEYEAGYGKKIDITLNQKTRVIIVEDDARGIPVGIRDDGINALVAAMTIPHSGAKHDNDTYATAIGVNGIGAKVVCHTSERMEVEVWSQDGHHKAIFTHDPSVGAVTTGVQKMSSTIPTKRGTKITYKPLRDSYHDEWFDEEEVINLITEASYFAPGLVFSLDYDGHKTKIVNKNGLIDAMVTKGIHKNILVAKDTLENTKVEIVLQWTFERELGLQTYGNNLRLHDGGAFFTGFKTSLTKAFNGIGGTNYKGEVIRKYLSGFVSVKVGQPQFSNQSKTSLANPEARTATAKLTTVAIKEFFTKNPKDYEAIVAVLEKEVKAEHAADRARAAEKEIVSGNKNMKRIAFTGKLADAVGKGYKEIFIFEGDSASGHSKTARNPQEQAILPLKGKILNTYSKELSDILKSETIKTIIKVLGCGAGSVCDVKKCRYDKVIIATDADAKHYWH